jgi:hypothetical protein
VSSIGILTFKNEGETSKNLKLQRGSTFTPQHPNVMKVKWCKANP